MSRDSVVLQVTRRAKESFLRPDGRRLTLSHLAQACGPPPSGAGDQEDSSLLALLFGDEKGNVSKLQRAHECSCESSQERGTYVYCSFMDPSCATSDKNSACWDHVEGWYFDGNGRLTENTRLFNCRQSFDCDGIVDHTVTISFDDNEQPSCTVQAGESTCTQCQIIEDQTSSVKYSCDFLSGFEYLEYDHGTPLHPFLEKEKVVENGSGGGSDNALAIVAVVLAVVFLLTLAIGVGLFYVLSKTTHHDSDSMARSKPKPNNTSMSAEPNVPETPPPTNNPPNQYYDTDERIQETYDM